MKKDKITAIATSAASLVGLTLTNASVPAAQTEPVNDSMLAQALPTDSVSSAVLFDSDGSPYPPKPGFIG